ncbi:MAG: D-alanyl-D-alanine carboxypeptidase/D-alanyl-D-alanine-endopeptidase [Planctomycetales bacterium 4572_13]|nr:MAG: D-alanyl-D-alanine carboxypeptidase/D-alanyl-D-alanine-endopeptidase [Planctomycetales bacterium 4572_13]
MPIKIKKILFLCFFCLVCGFSPADMLGNLLSKHKQTRTVFSILAVDARSGKTIYQRNPNKPMIPASNMKLITSSAALHYLGAGYSFETKIGLLGKDLVIVGGGDPLLGDPKRDSYPCQASNTLMDKIIEILQKAGVSTVKNIVVDTSFFDNNRVHPSWPREQLNQWYACEVSGLNFYDNCVHIKAVRKANRAVLNMTPANDYIHLVNQLRLISKGSSAVGAYRNSTPNKLLVKGKLNQQAGFDVAIEKPAGFFASILNDKLKASGISVRGQLLQKYVKQNNDIHYLVIFKTPIADVLRRANTDSLGLAAESLVKTISAENTQGRINGEWEHGLKLVSRYLDSLKVPKGLCVLDDGSGLSRNNRLTTTALVAVLSDMYKSENAEVFTASLAVGGQSGTIKKYFHKSPYKGNIIGKTGYISGVRSFSGICKTPEGDIIFSILTEKGNGYTRRCINDIAQTIYNGKL